MFGAGKVAGSGLSTLDGLPAVYQMNQSLGGTSRTVGITDEFT